MRKLTLVMIMLATILALPSTLLAADAALSAVTTRDGPATVVDLTGTGFAPGTDVHLVVSRNGGAVSTQTLRTDENGTFNSTFTYGPGRGGRYTFSASGQDASATTEVVVVESAGGGVTSTPPTLPPTDAAPAAPAPGPATGGPGVLSLLLVAALVSSPGVGFAILALWARRA
jgi:hypothetical protein